MSRSRWLSAAALAAALAFVFADQPHDDGFSRGHRGWVSAHTLAIAEHSGASNGFVGYTVSLRTEKSRDLHYFDRYPFFFAAGLELVQNLFADQTAEEIRVSRHVMNVVYALTLVAAVLLLVELGLSLEAAVASAAFAGASYTMVAFRDMVHFDQPAVLGIVVLLWSIARHGRGGSAALVLAASVIAVSLGRGYASFAVLGVWWTFEAASLLARRRPGFVRAVMASVPTRACLVAIAAGTLFLGYNVVMEARIRGIAVSEVGIIRSAWQRLSLDEGFNERNEKRLTPAQMLNTQQSGIVHGIVPYARRDPLQARPWLRTLLAAVVLAASIAFAATRDARTRNVWLTAVVAGPVWLLFMRNLAAFHQYTAVYLLPLCLTFFAAFACRLPRPASAIAAVAASALLASATQESNRAILANARTARLDTLDMTMIERALEPGDAVATDKQIFRGVPFAIGFYLPDHDVVVEGPATLVISRRRRFAGENLTPGNAGIFLYRPDDRWMASSLLARYHRDSVAAANVKFRHSMRKTKRR